MWWDVFHLMENILYSPLCFTEIFSSQPIKIFVSWKKRSKGTSNHIRQLIFQFIVKIHTIFHLAIKWPKIFAASIVCHGQSSLLFPFVPY